MLKRTLGKTGLSITGLGYGAMALRDLDESTATRILNELLDLGINYIDTSPDYGLSEILIGNAISHRRGEYILATKCGCNHDEAGHHLDPQHIWTRAKLLENIERSLRQMKTDHIDVWQLHSPAPKDLPGGAQDDVMLTMQAVKQQGKVGAVGISYPNTKKGSELYPSGHGYRNIPLFMEHGFDMMQIVYGGLTRQSEQRLEQVAGAGMGVVVRGVVKQYFENYPELFAQAGLHALCQPGEGMNDFLIRYALSHPAVTTAIIGTGSSAHLAENVKAAEAGPLAPDVYAEAKRRLDAVGVAAQP